MPGKPPDAEKAVIFVTESAASEETSVGSRQSIESREWCAKNMRVLSCEDNSDRRWRILRHAYRSQPVRLSTHALCVILVNNEYPMGRGIAYGTPRPEHLLNVVVRNMSAFPDLPSHFVDWLRNRSDFAEIPRDDLPDQFVPRRVYGDYLQDLLFWQAQPLAGPGRVEIRSIDDEVLDVAPTGRGAQLVLKGGDAVQADRVVLATGNLAPHDLLPPGPIHDHPAYCANPWRAWYENVPEPHEDVLLVGTGLTMIDAFLTLRAAGWRARFLPSRVTACCRCRTSRAAIMRCSRRMMSRTSACTSSWR